MAIVIKGEDHIINVSILDRPYPNADNIWDLNWLICNVEITVPGFKANYETHITTGELLTFYDELKIIHRDLEGTVEFNPLECGIYIKGVVDDRLGQIDWEIEAQYPTGTGAKLAFEFTVDQSYLYSTLQDMKDAIKEYPVIKK